MLWAQQDKQRLIEITFGPLLDDTGVPLAIIGILVVFMALTLVAAFISVLPRLIEALTGGLQNEVNEPSLWQSVAEDELSEEIVVVIAAAVSEVIRKPHRIVRIRGLTPEDLGWSLQGRMQHHQSHAIRSQDHQSI